MNDDPLLWSLEEAGRQLGGVSARTVRRMIQAGELPSLKVRGRLKVPAAAVREWVERQVASTGSTSDLAGAKATTSSRRRQHRTAEQASAELHRLLFGTDE